MDVSRYISLRHKLHQNAELSGEEVKTAVILKEFLRNNSQADIYERDGWFYAVKWGGKKKLAFRADMDALPIPESKSCPYGSKNKNVSHRCGHDGHSAALAALACECDSENTVYFIFQSAEETGMGGKECAKLLKEEGIGEVYGFHNLPGFEKGKIFCKNGTFACASLGLELRFSGKSSHAAYPENGINPAYVIAEIISALDGLKHDLKAMTLITIVGVSIGGEAYGTSAGEGVLRLTVRAELENELMLLKNRIIALCEKKAVNMKFGFKLLDPFPETKNHALGVEKVKNASWVYGELNAPMRWSEDFGYYLKEAEGAFFGIGCGKDHPQLHTEDYDFPDDILEIAVDVLNKLAK